MAQKLKKMGKQVDLLCLVDVTFDRDKEFGNRLVCILKMIREFKWQYAIMRFISRLRFIKIRREEKQKKQLLKKQNTVDLNDELYKRYRHLFMTEYKPSNYDGSIVSIESKEFLIYSPILAPSQKRTLEEITQGDFKQYVMKSFHHTMFDKPYINSLINYLKEHL